MYLILKIIYNFFKKKLMENKVKLCKYKNSKYVNLNLIIEIFPIDDII